MALQLSISQPLEHNTGRWRGLHIIFDIVVILIFRKTKTRTLLKYETNRAAREAYIVHSATCNSTKETHRHKISDYTDNCVCKNLT